MESKFFNGVKILLIIVGLFTIFDWAYPRVQRLVDKSAKIDYELEERYRLLERVYSDGLRFGEEAAIYYEFTEEKSLEEIRNIALEQYKSREPSSIWFGHEDYFDFPTKEDFMSWTWRSYLGEKDTDNLMDAFKSGYMDAFINYYK